MGVLYYKLCIPSSRDSIQAKITKLEAIIDALFTTALTSVQNGQYVEYEMDNGQTRTNVTYSKVSDVTTAIQQYENLLERYMAKLVNENTDRVVQLVDSRNFRKRC